MELSDLKFGEWKKVNTMTFSKFRELINMLIDLNNPFDPGFFNTPVKVMYNGNEYNFHLSIDQPGIVQFINADDEENRLLDLSAEVDEIYKRIESLRQLDNHPDLYEMDHEYKADFIKTVDGYTIETKIVFYISDSEEL